MKVVVNGFIEEIEPGSTVEDLIFQFEEVDKTLIVEVNGRFIGPKEYPTLKVRAGDRVEMIHPAFGG